MYTSFSINLECYDSYISNKMLNKTNFLQLAGRYSVSPFRTNNQPVSLGYQPLHILLTLRRKLSITQSQRTCRKMYLCFEQTSTMRINNCYKFNCYLALKIVLTLSSNLAFRHWVLTTTQVHQSEKKRNNDYFQSQ